MAALSKAQVCGRTLPGIAGANRTGAWMFVCRPEKLYFKYLQVIGHLGDLDVDDDIIIVIICPGFIFVLALQLPLCC